MEILIGRRLQDAKKYLKRCQEVARGSLCHRAKCGSVIARYGIILGEGFNAPPGNVPLEKCFKESLSEDFDSDKTCCIHAEERAIFDALLNYNHNLNGSVIYFFRTDLKGEPLPAGKPYCTRCSKIALDMGIRSWVLWHDFGICGYEANEYNEISFGRINWDKPND